MVEITNRDELKTFLRDAPREWSQIIAVRAALRVFPCWTTPVGRFDLTLSLCRALFISWAAAVWPAPEMRRAASSALVAALATADVSSEYAPFGYYGARCAAQALYAALYAADANHHAAYTAAYAARLMPIWREVSLDAQRLVNAANTGQVDLVQIRQAPLWTGDIPKALKTAWTDRQTELLGQPDQQWSLWLEWYNRILAGEPTAFSGLTPADNEAFCVRLATEPDAFWDRPVAEVNRDILDRLSALHRPLQTELPDTPPQRPASLQPVRRGRTIIGPNDRAHVAAGTEYLEIRNALKEHLVDLADELEDDRRTNAIDIRSIKFIRHLSDRVPQSEPTYAEIFDIALARDDLATYFDTVIKDEWPDFWVTRVMHVMAHFDRLIAASHSWRDMVLDAQDVVTAPTDSVEPGDARPPLLPWELKGQSLKMSRWRPRVHIQYSATPSPSTVPEDVSVTLLSATSNLFRFFRLFISSSFLFRTKQTRIKIDANNIEASNIEGLNPSKIVEILDNLVSTKSGPHGPGGGEDD